MCDFTKFFSFCGQRLPLCIFACTQGEFEIGLLMLETLSPEDAQKMTNCFNFTAYEMLLAAAKYEAYEDELDEILAAGPNGSRIPFTRQQVKRTIRSLLRLHDPKRERS